MCAVYIVIIVNPIYHILCVFSIRALFDIIDLICVLNAIIIDVIPMRELEYVI